MDTLNIHYDDFNTNLCDGLQSILTSSEMSDVTLAVEGKYFKAHQLILSMFSTYFRELFRVNPSRNAIFFMKNVKHRIVHNLLVFMYEGKVQIPSEDIQLFVDTANELKIKGLANDMDPKAAEISIGQVNKADNIKPVINRAPAVKRTSERIKQKAKKHKASNNEPVQSTLELSVLTVKTNKHKRVTEDFNVYDIQLKEEVTDTIDVDSTEIHGLYDKTNALDTITSKESILPLASSQIEIQGSANDTEEQNDLDVMIDVGPTEIHGLVDGTMEHDEGENDFLVAIDHKPLPPPEGKPVTITICRSGTTKKMKGVIWGDFRYSFKYESEFYARWRCSATHKCKAKLLWAVEDGLIALSQSHNHGKRCIFNQSATNLESRTLYAVSNEYFWQRVMGRKTEKRLSVLRNVQLVVK